MQYFCYISHNSKMGEAMVEPVAICSLPAKDLLVKHLKVRAIALPKNAPINKLLNPSLLTESTLAKLLS